MWTIGIMLLLFSWGIILMTLTKETLNRLKADKTGKVNKIKEDSLEEINDDFKFYESSSSSSFEKKSLIGSG